MSWAVSWQERFHTKISCARLHRTPLSDLTYWVSWHRNQQEGTLINTIYYTICLTVRMCASADVFLFYEEACQTRKAEHKQKVLRVASLMRNFLPRYSELPALDYAAQLGSHSWSTAIKYDRELSLAPKPYYNRRVAFTKEWGEVMSTKLQTQSYVLMDRVTCSDTRTQDNGEHKRR